MPQARPMTCGNEHLHIKLNGLKDKLCLNRVHYSFQDKIIHSPSFPLPPFSFCFGVLFCLILVFLLKLVLTGGGCKSKGQM